MVGGSPRLFALALGYEDLSDHDELHKDPLFGVLVGKLEAKRQDCEALAGKSTLNRLERYPKAGSSLYHKILPDSVASDCSWSRSWTPMRKHRARSCRT